MLLHENVILADNVRYCDDLWSRSRGLRFRKKIKSGEALILVASDENYFETTLDMFFVFFPIDVLWLDNNKRIVDMKENLRPFTPMITPRKPARYVIELPRGSIKNMKLGDEIKF